MKFVKRLAPPPWELSVTTQGPVCPDLWETDTGDYAVIGRDITDEMKSNLPEDAVLSHGERIVLLPRKTLLAAKQNIPES